MLLTEKALAKLIDEQRTASNDPATWDSWYAQHSQAATIEAPLGELMNSRIAGFVWAWKMQDRIAVLPIGDTDHFNAQGLEGKFAVQAPLTTALLAAGELAPGRRQVRI